MPLTRIRSTRDFFRIWFFWKKPAIITFFAIIGVVMVYSYLCTPIYQSTAKILLLPRTSEGQIISTSKSVDKVFTVSSKDVNTEMELIFSNTVLENTVKAFENGKMGLEKKDKPLHQKFFQLLKKGFNGFLTIIGLKESMTPFQRKVQQLKNALDVTYTDKSNILFVSLKAEDPKAAATILNKLLEIYIAHHDRVFTKEGGVQFYNDQAKKFAKKLEEAETKLKEFQKKNGIIDLKTQNEANITLLAEFNRMLKELEVKYAERKTRINLLRKALKMNKNEILITREMRTIPSIVELEKSLVPLIVKRTEIEKSFTAESREYQDMNNQIKSIQKDILKEVQRAIKTDQLELASLKTKMKTLRKKIAELNKKAIELDQKARKLHELQRQVELYKQNYMLYASKTEDARIYAERAKRNLANVSIADKASIPSQPVFPKRILMFFVSTFFGLIAAIALPFTLEALDRKLKTAGDVEELLGLPVICSFPDKNNKE